LPTDNSVISSFYPTITSVCGSDYNVSPSTCHASNPISLNPQIYCGCNDATCYFTITYPYTTTGILELAVYTAFLTNLYSSFLCFPHGRTVGIICFSDNILDVCGRVYNRTLKYLVYLCSQIAELSCCQSAPTQSPERTSTPKGATTAVLAGSVVGAVCGTALIGLTLYFFVLMFFLLCFKR
jgi:hypothetical protein